MATRNLQVGVAREVKIQKFVINGLTPDCRMEQNLDDAFGRVSGANSSDSSNENAVLASKKQLRLSLMPAEITKGVAVEPPEHPLSQSPV